MLDKQQIEFVISIMSRGHKITNPLQIQDAFIGFYNNLLGTTATELPMIDKESVRGWICLDLHEQQLLCYPITDAEVNKAVFSLLHDKSPGIDGFQIEFFKRNLKVMQADMTQAIRDFFDNGKLLKEVILWATSC